METHRSAPDIVGVRRVRWCVAALLLLAAGCSTTGLPYQPETAGGRGGYAEQRLWDGRYRITFTAPPGTRIASIDAMARRRAADFTLSLGFRGFVVLDRSITRDIYVLLGPGEARTTYGGDYRAWRRFWRIYCLGEGLQHCDDDPLWPSRQKSKRRIEVAYTIRMTNVPEAAAIDARTALGPDGN